MGSRGQRDESAVGRRQRLGRVDAVQRWLDGSIPVLAPAAKPLVVTIPGGDPTGVVLGDGSDFVVDTSSGSAPASFIFDSEL